MPGMVLSPECSGDLGLSGSREMMALVVPALVPGMVLSSQRSGNLGLGSGSKVAAFFMLPGH